MREKLANLEMVSGAGVSPVRHAQDARATRDEVNTSRVSGRVKAPLEELRSKAASTELHLRSPRDASVGNELNLIGKKTDEAIDMIDKFLDQAFLSGATELRIIHGHGTGALRKAVTEFLSDHPHVERFAPAPQDQGGSGATLVTLKQ
jgi:dsDNA-specific endonuclease/ATPase MutS2